MLIIQYQVKKVKEESRSFLLATKRFSLEFQASLQAPPAPIFAERKHGFVKHKKLVFAQLTAFELAKHPRRDFDQPFGDGKFLLPHSLPRVRTVPKSKSLVLPHGMAQYAQSGAMRFFSAWAHANMFCNAVSSSSASAAKPQKALCPFPRSSRFSAPRGQRPQAPPAAHPTFDFPSSFYETAVGRDDLHLHGINLPLAFSAFTAARSRPPQHGTCMRTIVKLLMSF